ncbi:ecotropic viral integration site 5 ortholog-like [Stegodyphus dumicola]|uniref:ecotropic viral integration site 5 ortholog-like n=1 Tax=Stegodyphus dumicola TaxID=202533 RepID=UPI0015A99D67|nr:ecotropic viral integration site 5 ortholog-like [Stegodyphus dumicola]
MGEKDRATKVYNPVLSNRGFYGHYNGHPVLKGTKVPQVHERMVQTGVSWSMYVSKWFICLFAEVLPIETVLRIWDCLFYEGSKILLRVAVTLVIKNQDKILAAKNFVEITEVFKSLPLGATVTECHTFMHAIFRVPGSFPKAQILKLREQCREKVEKEQEHTKVLHQQQKQRQLEEKQAREAALELKRQNEEREAAFMAEQEAEKLKEEILQNDASDSDLKLNLKEDVDTNAQSVESQPDNKQTSFHETERSESSQISKAAVIEPISTESLKVANGNQVNSVLTPENPRSPSDNNSEPHA